ncbi:hypothetical protein [Cellulosimicrobium arenosum]|uniref:Uncharacterized protein n=1 Tax=Cellulosimicrobium arenosum TaxID=2708133 RepID=A0A927G878_9MICO|nr:hypothetical protein [Cellulosimicrobium arenosum]MBD8078716.1 hypothetical protein [Cellulosimicrobium arenosum]
MSIGWWRTNGWWIPVLVVALAALGGLSWRSEAVQTWWTMQPHRAHASDAEGWAQVGDVRFTVAGFERVDWISDELAGRVEAPEGYALWVLDLSARSDVAPPADGAETEPTYTCASELRDTAGRVYEVGASALPGAPYPDALICSGPVSARWTQYFLTPDDAVPAQVRVIDTEQLPDYWSLPVAPADPSGS